MYATAVLQSACRADQDLGYQQNEHAMRSIKTLGCPASSAQNQQRSQTLNFKMDSNMDIKHQLATEKSIDEIDAQSVEKGTIRSGFIAWAKNLSVETRGIQRVTDDERQTNTTKVWNACTFW
jgi:hypothetical protein